MRGNTIAINGNNMVLFVIVISILIRFFWLGSFNLLVEEAYYWNYAQHLDWSYLDHPPMVAMLIKLSTSIFGNSEWAVRLPAILCFFPTAYFSYALTNLIVAGAGWYSVLLLSILPFYFVQSIVMTPDQPLIMCWAAALYYLYRALVLGEAKYWYVAGLWIGIGLLSKYTIVLLGLATLIYILWVPEARFWFKRKEPYLSAAIAFLCFTPVIYWNSQHDWASFIFQGSRRLHSSFYFSFHHILGLLVLFLLPLGIVGLWQLSSNIQKSRPNYLRFLQIFSFTPLIIFSFFSFSHEVKFNWIGPGLLAVIPWLALLINVNKHSSKNYSLLKMWITTGVVALLAYNGMLLMITTGHPVILYQKFLYKFINWEDLVLRFNHIAEKTLASTHKTPVFVPLDLYNIQSELAFYQTKLFIERKIKTKFPIIGRHIFNEDSLMYRYWQPNTLAENTPMILISRDKELEYKEIWAESQGTGVKAAPFYYQIKPYRKQI